MTFRQKTSPIIRTLGFLLFLIFASAGSLLFAAEEKPDEQAAPTPEEAAPPLTNAPSPNVMEGEDTEWEDSGESPFAPKEEETATEEAEVAEEAETAVESAADPIKFRFEASLFYEPLFPYSQYGSWETLNLGFYIMPSPKVTYNLFASLHMHQDAFGFSGGVGVTVNWLDWFTTYSELGGGIPTGGNYLPLFTASQLFDFTLFEVPDHELGMHLSFGLTYYHSKDPMKDLFPQAGLGLYIQNWIVEYTFFPNWTWPGTVFSTHHQVSLTYNDDGNFSTYLRTQFGQEGYLATYIEETPTPTEKNWFLEVAVGHRHWVGKEWGLFGEASYMKLFHGWDKAGFMFGGFVDF